MKKITEVTTRVFDKMQVQFSRKNWEAAQSILITLDYKCDQKAIGNWSETDKLNLRHRTG